MAPAIEFQSVTKRFPDGTLGLADATWSVAEGVHTSLLGPAASGKTTAVRLLQASLRPTGGSVLLFEVPTDGPDYRERDYRASRARVGIVPQRPGMYPDLNAGEYMALAARLSGCREDRVVRTLGLDAYLHARMTYLSPGVQRRLALAAATVADPDVLVLDEPTAGLDPVEAEDLRHHVAESMRGRTVLLCTSDRAEAEALCTRVVILRGGRVVDHGTWAGVDSRSTPRLRLAARQGVQVLRDALAGMDRQVETRGHAVLVPVSDPEREGAELLRRLLLEAELDVYECALVPPPLLDGPAPDGPQ
jgi:ABC-type multidrug transport system ATPase subunit